MSESVDNLLLKAEENLRVGDRQAAGVLLHKILLQDITNHQAWLLLYSILGRGQSLENFQQGFAQRYYPQFAHLLSQAPSPERPDSSPQLASAPVQVLPDQPVSTPVQPLPDIPPISAPVGEGLAQPSRPQSPIAKKDTVNFWIDGKKQDPIRGNQERLVSLPAGRHTFVVKSTSRASQSIKFDIKPHTRVRMICKPAAISAQGSGPWLKITLFLEAPPPKQDKLDAHQFWSILRTFLILILVSAFVVWLSYIVFYMVTN